MPLVAIDAGHGRYTPGKRTPAGEPEWTFNNVVVKAAIKRLKSYGIDSIRLDDPTGKIDVPLTRRTDKANEAGADVLVSHHHNAYLGKWGGHTGTETFTYEGNWKDAERLAKIVQGKMVDAYELHDRGLKKANFHMLRESHMPAILTEGGYMDSTIDIKKMRDNNVLKRVGEAIADGIAEYFGYTVKRVEPQVKGVNNVEKREYEEGSKSLVKEWREAYELGITDGANPTGTMTREQMIAVLMRYDKLKRK